MPNVTEGITTAPDEFSRAPEAPLDSETAQHVALIKEQTQRTRGLPADDSFTKEAVAAAFADNSTTIQGGIETAPEREARERDEAFDANYGPDSEAGQALAERERLMELGRATERWADIVGPALEVLGTSWDDEERASALVQLSPAERELAKSQGLLDDEEERHLVQVGAEILDTRQRVHGEMQAALHDMQSTEDRLSRWTAIRAEYQLVDDRDAEDVLQHVVQRVAADTDGRMTLGALPGPAWEAAVRASLAQLQDAQRAHEVRNWKQQVVDADRLDIASGLTEGGVPTRPRDIIAPRFDPAGATAKALARARSRAETDDEIRASVLHGHEPTSVNANVREDGEQIPAATRAKMASLFGGH